MDRDPSVLYQEIFGKGEARGELKRSRVALTDLCEAYGVALTPEREAWIQSAEIRQLDELRAHLERERAWPDALPA